MKRRRQENIDGVDHIFMEEMSYYTLKVPAGTYTSNSLFSLLWEMFTHRLWHWRKGHGWID